MYRSARVVAEVTRRLAVLRRKFSAGYPFVPSRQTKVWKITTQQFHFHRSCSTSIGTINCWSCSSPVLRDVFICATCNTVQQPKDTIATVNYFEIFRIPTSYDVDTHGLARKYRKLQQQLHPDKFVNKDQKEKEFSADISSVINKSYKVLLDPLLRGEYLLRINNKLVEESSIQMNSDFLRLVLETNEKIEAANTAEKVIQLREDNERTFTKLMTQFSEVFKRNDLDTALVIFSKARYYRSMKEHIKEKERRFGVLRL